MNIRELRELLAGMSREELERMLAILAATAPDEFEEALNTLHASKGGASS